MNTYQALYYPFVHFKDDGWLKVAALYWDRLARIVPQDYVTDDSDTVRALSPCIDTVRPDGVLGAPTQAAFVDFVQRYAPALRQRYGIEHVGQWPQVPAAQRPPRAGGASGPDARLGYVYDDKIGSALRAALLDAGLVDTASRGERWIGMHPRLAWVYVTALAEQIARERGLRPLTDETRDHVAVSDLSPERLAQALLGDVALVGATPTATEVEGLLVSIAFKAVLPKDPATLPVERVLAFRDRWPNERTAFQQAAADLLRSRDWLQAITDAAVLEQRLRDEFDKVWAARLAELRAKLDDVGIDTVIGCFNVKAVLPAGVAGAAGAMALPLNPIAAGAAGLALGVIPALRDRRKAANDALRASPVSYLYRLERDLAPKDLWSWVRQRAREFAIGV